VGVGDQRGEADSVGLTAAGWVDVACWGYAALVQSRGRPRHCVEIATASGR
jgi:hypothetical protein